MGRSGWLLGAALVTSCILDREGSLVGGATPGGGGDGGELFDCTSVEDCGGVNTTCSERTCENSVCGSISTREGTPCTESGGAVCDGNGECVECNTASECTGPELCVNKECVTPGGQPCGAADECETGFCADGVCCGAECTGLCEACTLLLTSVTDGTCAPITSGTNPEADCLPTEVCNGAGSCIGCQPIWSAGYGAGTQSHFSRGIAVDALGDVVVAGEFRGDINFGGMTLNSINGGRWDAFVAKLGGALGAHVWSAGYGTSGASTFVAGVAVDSLGDVIVVGRFNGTINFGSMVATQLVSSNFDIFVAKLSGADGSRLWSFRYGGATANDHVGGVAVDLNDDVIVVGQFDGTIDFGGAAMTTTGANPNAYVAKLNGEDGARLWSFPYGDGTQQDQAAEAVAVDQDGDVLVVGRLRGGMNFGTGTLTSLATNRHDVFVAKLLALDGTAVWSHGYGDGVFDQFGEAVATDSLDNVIVTGHFQGDIDFGGVPMTSTDNDRYDVFVAKLEPLAGAQVWSFHYGDGANNQRGRGVATDASNNIRLTGQFEGSMDFGDGALPSAGSDYDVFIAKLDSAGNVLCRSAHGDGTAGQDGTAVAIDGNGNAFFTGSFQGEIEFGGMPILSGTQRDVFVAGLGP